MKEISLNFYYFDPRSAIEPISLEISSTWVISVGLLIPSQSFIRNQKAFRVPGERRPLSHFVEVAAGIFTHQGRHHLNLSACLPTVEHGHPSGGWQLCYLGSHLHRLTWQPSREPRSPDTLSPFSSLFPGEPRSRLKKFLLVSASPRHSAALPRPCPSASTFTMSCDAHYAQSLHLKILKPVSPSSMAERIDSKLS